MILLHCLWFEYDVTLVFLFLFDFVHSYARYACCSIVCLRFQVMQIKQVDCKMSTKRDFFKEIFPGILGQLHTQECKATKKQLVRLQLNLDSSV